MPAPDHYAPYSQFNREREYFTESLDIINWYRFFFILKRVIHIRPKNILEIGEGSGIIRHIIAANCEQYETMDVNIKLKPTYLNDIRIKKQELKERYDCVIAADILEHIPFPDFNTGLSNLYYYLTNGGCALITIPHRASYFLLMTPTYIPHVIRIPTGFLSVGAFYRRFIKRKIWIDPDHQWEIGDGKHSINSVESVMKEVGFEIEKRQTLLYVDFWILKKSTGTK